MIYAIIQGWWRHWHVYSVGHFEGDRTWMATFRNREDAMIFVQALQHKWRAHDGNDPVDNRS
jgi:hypothetical protein